MLVVRTAVASFILLHCAVALQSQFARKINFDQLEEQYADPEDEDWHEDSLDWKERMAEHSAPRVDSFDPSDPEGFVRSAGGQGGLQMAFATLRKKHVKSKADAELLANKWQGLLATGHVQVSAFAVEEREILFTESNGRMQQVRQFVLEQPEVAKFRHNDHDYYPPNRSKTSKTRSKKGKKKAKRKTRQPDKAQTRTKRPAQRGREL